MTNKLPDHEPTKEIYSVKEALDKIIDIAENKYTTRYEDINYEKLLKLWSRHLMNAIEEQKEEYTKPNNMHTSEEICTQKRHNLCMNEERITKLENKHD